MRNTTGCGRDTSKLELAEKVVILRQGTFSLVDLNGDGGLVIRGGREGLGLLGGDDGVTWDDLCEDSTSGLDTEGQRADVDEEDVASAFFAGENTTLESGSTSYCFIGVDSLGRFFAVEEIFEKGLDLGDTSGTTNKDDLKTPKVSISTRKLR